MFEISCTGSKTCTQLDTCVFAIHLGALSRVHVAQIWFLHIIPIENQSINVLKRLNDLCEFFEIKCPSFGNMYVHRGIINLTCIIVAVDSWCVCGCGRLGVAGGSQYTTSCEPPCGLAVFLGRPVPHQRCEIVI